MATDKEYKAVIDALSGECERLHKENEELKKALENHDTFMKYSYEQGKQDALSQEPCDKCVYSTKDGYCQYDDISETIPPLDPCETCGYAEGSPFCLQYCPHDAEREKEQEPTKRELGRDYLLQSCVEALKVLQAENDDLKEKLKQEPCTDAVSRDAIKKDLKNCMVTEIRDEDDDFVGYYNADTVDSIVRNLPSVNPQPCDDAISRSDILDAIGHGTTYTSEDLQRIIKNLPSVTQTPKYWIDKDNKIYKMPDDIPTMTIQYPTIQHGDTISRIEVMNAISDFVALEKYIDNHNHITFEPLEQMINSLPSVTQKSGKWTLMYEPKNMAVCSECGKCAYMYQDKTSAFCPNCGAKMESEEQTE